MPSSSSEIRCVCSRQPLLAKYGIKDGKVYVHLRVYKQKKIYGEMVAVGGEVQLHCRECLRWFRIILSGRTAGLEEAKTPPSID